MLKKLYSNYFLTGAIPADAMTGEYNLSLVLLSYFIASFAAFIALVLSAHLRQPSTNLLSKISWTVGGAFAMGAGIWSMHFIGMLAFVMPMPMSYDFFWTGFSMALAVLTAGAAFVFLSVNNPRAKHYIFCGIFLGISIPMMHYAGMAGMKGVKIYYTPGLFILSILIAIIAATASIWLSINSEQGSFFNRFKLKLASALIMGVAIAGMHYTGMFAAVFMPSDNHAQIMENENAIDPIYLAMFISAIVICIMLTALIVSYSKYLYSVAQNKQSNFLMTVLDNLRAGVIACDAQLNVTFINKTSEMLFGKSTLLGKPKKSAARNYGHLLDIVTIYEENDDQTRTPVDFYLVRNLLKHGKIYHSETGFIKSSTNLLCPVSFSINPLPLSKSGEFNGAVIIFVSTQERIDSEAALKRALKLSQEASNAKSAFLANMSHEIRTPLNGIMGMLQLLKITPLSETQKNYVDKGYESANFLLTILGDVLDIVKIESGNISFESIVFDIKSELASQMDYFTVQSKLKDIDLSYTLDPKIPSSVIGDPDKIKQILNNLLSNAIKFTPNSGKITVEAKVSNIEEETVCIEFSVLDSGIGIPPSLQSKIFEKFTQADESTTRKYGGTGLGLAITKQLVELMGGKIEVISDGIKGSNFIFTLKLGIGNFKQRTDIKNEEKNMETCKAKVLVVEDSEVNQLVISDMLKIMGCSVQIVDTGWAAIDAVKKESYDLIMMDCQMPGIDGFITSQKIREMEMESKMDRKNVIIALTANAQKGTRERCLDAGMNEYISKPFIFDDLKNIMTKYI